MAQKLFDAQTKNGIYTYLSNRREVLTRNLPEGPKGTARYVHSVSDMRGPFDLRSGGDASSRSSMLFHQEPAAIFTKFASLTWVDESLEP